MINTVKRVDAVTVRNACSDRLKNENHHVCLHGCSAVALFLLQIMRRRDALVCVFEQCVQVNAAACGKSIAVVYAWATLQNEYACLSLVAVYCRHCSDYDCN